MASRSPSASIRCSHERTIARRAFTDDERERKARIARARAGEALEQQMQAFLLDQPPDIEEPSAEIPRRSRDRRQRNPKIDRVRRGRRHPGAHGGIRPRSARQDRAANRPRVRSAAEPAMVAARAQKLPEMAPPESSAASPSIAMATTHGCRPSASASPPGGASSTQYRTASYRRDASRCSRSTSIALAAATSVFEANEIAQRTPPSRRQP